MLPRSLLVLATTNVGKIAEFRALLHPLIDLSHVRLVTPVDLSIVIPPVEEIGRTFQENARLKAVTYAAATGYAALADDSGLCVDALGGAPGLYSARWAGPDASDADRTARLLGELENTPAPLRTAQFVCAAAVALPSGSADIAEGICHGSITRFPRGTNGFGYDPVFLFPELDLTMAELPPERKNQISHRAIALNSLRSPLLRLGFPAA